MQSLCILDSESLVIMMSDAHGLTRKEAAVERSVESGQRFSFRSVRPDDGAALWRVVESTGTLELNSPYFYVLFAADFGHTCLLAEHEGNPVGAVIGYRPPRDPATAFVWQVGVLPEYRGRDLGSRMIGAWLDLPAMSGCTWLAATVADDNLASKALFRRVARDCGVQCKVSAHFTADRFPIPHPPEPLYRIGPLSRAAAVPC